MKRKTACLFFLVIFILLIPVSSLFSNDSETITAHERDSILIMTRLENPDLVKQLEKTIHRHDAKASPDTKEFPKTNYQFYIDKLSQKIELDPVSVTDGEEKHSKIYKYIHF